MQPPISHRRRREVSQLRFRPSCTNANPTPRTLTLTGEPAAFQAVLRKGDSLIFTATTKHAATPNPSGVSRGLLFSLYAVDGREACTKQRLILTLALALALALTLLLSLWMAARSR